MTKKTQIFLITLLSTWYLQAQSVTNMANEAGEESNKGNYLKAIQLYNQIVAVEPDVAKWYFYRGQSHSLIQEYKQAEADYSKSIELAPQYADAYLSRAILYYTVNQSERSINDYNQALRYLKDDNLKAFIYNNRGYSKMQRKDIEGSYQDFMKAYQIDKNSVTTLDNLGKVLNQMDRGDEALVYFKKMTELDTNNLSAYSDIAYTLLNLSRFEESIEQYNMILIQNPNSPLALTNRGLAKMNLRDYAGAIDDANRSLQLYPQNAYAFRNRGMIYMAMGKNTEGCHDFKQALNLGFSQKYDNEVEEFFKHSCTSSKF
jgi:tetratricopeptide (TPR) repeat protein